MRTYFYKSLYCLLLLAARIQQHISLTHPSVGTLACRNNRFCDRTDGEPCALFQNRKPLAKTNICPHLWRRILCLPLLHPIKRVHCDIRTNIIRISNLSWRIPTRLVGFTLENSYKSPKNAIHEQIKPSQEAKIPQNKPNSPDRNCVTNVFKSHKQPKSQSHATKIKSQTQKRPKRRLGQQFIGNVLPHPNQNLYAITEANRTKQPRGLSSYNQSKPLRPPVFFRKSSPKPQKTTPDYHSTASNTHPNPQFSAQKPNREPRP